MLRSELIHPKISEVLARAGHSSKVLIADGNYPAASAIGPRAELVSLNLAPGLDVAASRVGRQISLRRACGESGGMPRRGVRRVRYQSSAWVQALQPFYPGEARFSRGPFREFRRAAHSVTNSSSREGRRRRPRTMAAIVESWIYPLEPDQRRGRRRARGAG